MGQNCFLRGPAAANSAKCQHQGSFCRQELNKCLYVGMYASVRVCLWVREVGDGRWTASGRPRQRAACSEGWELSVLRDTGTRQGRGKKRSSSRPCRLGITRFKVPMHRDVEVQDVVVDGWSPGLFFSFFFFPWGLSRQ